MRVPVGEKRVGGEGKKVANELTANGLTQIIAGHSVR